MKEFFIKNKKYIALILAVILAVGIFGVYKCFGNKDGAVLKAALLYCGDSDSEAYNDTYSHLEQSFVANCTFEKVDVSTKKVNPDKFDLIYLDSSVTQMPELKDSLVSYVEKGNYLFVPNDFAEYFDLAFFGAKEIVKLEKIPSPMVYPQAGKDMGGIQGIIKDFEKIYTGYNDYQELALLDYGYGFVQDTATSLADFEGLSVYGINEYGKGKVFYTNPYLPNTFHINGFSMKPSNDSQVRFSNSTATANQLILSEFASYVSKMKYGYSVKKILGSFGNPDMAWQLHYEELTGIQNNAAVIFGEMCKQNRQIPSYTLIRNTYKWFSKYETITYLLNDEGFHMDFKENAYSSGTHVVENDEFLSLAEAENTGSYFAENYDFLQMAYPCIFDENGDGIAEIVSGSSDGKFYYFEGVSFEDNWKVSDRTVLMNENGDELTVGAYSSPAVCDYDNDGINDIISGCEKGEVVLFKGIDRFHFRKEKVLIEGDGTERTMPYVGDLDGNGIPDMAVGSLDGAVKIYNADKSGNYALKETLVCKDEMFVAPFIYDYNDDGKNDIVYGSFHGYIRKMKNTGDFKFEDDGYYATDELNYKGNNYIKFGTNCVPRLFDINGDKKDDLIAGELEYGLAIPIDSPYYKDRYALMTQVDYIKNNRFYLGVHFYSNSFASEKREAEELRLHKRAFDSYAIDYDCVGANMHTWYMSIGSASQTIESAKNAGLLWVSGFQPSNSSVIPQTATENALSCPFFLDFENREMMVTNATVYGYGLEDFWHMSAGYDLPLSQYYHCDFVYRDATDAQAMIDKLSAYQKQHSYNFVREDQMIKSSAAAYNSVLSAKTLKDGGLKLKSSGDKKNFKLYDEDYQSCTGVKIEFAEATDVSKISINADVWRFDKAAKALYLALDKEVHIDFGKNGEKEGYSLISEDKAHILGVNIPANVSVKGKKASVKFEDDGMMSVYVLGEVENCTPGFEAVYDEGITTITKFGAESDLEFTFK